MLKIHNHLYHKEIFPLLFRNVRNNLRIILSLSSMDDQLEKIAFKHPSMISSMEVICLRHWTKQELVNCAQFILKGKCP